MSMKSISPALILARQVGSVLKGRRWPSAPASARAPSISAAVEAPVQTLIL